MASDSDTAAAKRTGRSIRWARIGRGMSLRALALKAEVDKGNLSRAERGLWEPPQRTLRRIADALGLEVSQLITGRVGRPTREQVLAVRHARTVAQSAA